MSDTCNPPDEHSDLVRIDDNQQAVQATYLCASRPRTADTKPNIHLGDIGKATKYASSCQRVENLATSVTNAAIRQINTCMVTNMAQSDGAQGDYFTS